MNKFYQCEHCNSILNDEKSFEAHNGTCFLNPDIHTHHIEKEEKKQDNQNGKIWAPPTFNMPKQNRVNWWDVYPHWFY